MDRLRNLFILCFADVVKNCNFTPGYSFGLWKKCVIAAVVDNGAIGKDSGSALAYSLADKLYLTHVHSVLEETDTLPR